MGSLERRNRERSTWNFCGFRSCKNFRLC